MTQPLLSEASRDELITELLGRYDHAIFAALLKHASGEDLPKGTSYRVTTRHAGNCVVCAGLAAHSSKISLEELESSGMDPDEEGDTSA